MNQIIKSILDTDLYKLSMMAAVSQLFPKAKVKYTFINRGNHEFPEGFAEELRREIRAMENLKLEDYEREFLEKKCKYFSPVFLDLLKGYKFDSSEVGVIQNGHNLSISIEGYWYRTILWEVPLMAIISELFFRNSKITDKSIRLKNNKDKVINMSMNGYSIADFGTRRRYSYDIQDELINDFVNYGKPSFVGSSNVHFAQKYNITPIGTHAHEWFMFHAAKYGYKQANHLALEHWVDVYRGDLGIALSDTFTTESFFKSFDSKFAKLFDGVRHDSGDPILFADKTIEHYKKLRIDPITKTIIFSDGLDIPTAILIGNYCRGKIKCSFGIGTNLTNDVGVTPLNMVIKMSEAKPENDEWIKTIKLSDTPGKHTGDSKEIEIAKYVLNIK